MGAGRYTVDGLGDCVYQERPSALEYAAAQYDVEFQILHAKATDGSRRILSQSQPMLNDDFDCHLVAGIGGLEHQWAQQRHRLVFKLARDPGSQHRLGAGIAQRVQHDAGQGCRRSTAILFSQHGADGLLSQVPGSAHVHIVAVAPLVTIRGEDTGVGAGTGGNDNPIPLVCAGSPTNYSIIPDDHLSGNATPLQHGLASFIIFRPVCSGQPKHTHSNVISRQPGLIQGLLHRGHDDAHRNLHIGAGPVAVSAAAGTQNTAPLIGYQGDRLCCPPINAYDVR